MPMPPPPGPGPERPPDDGARLRPEPTAGPTDIVPAAPNADDTPTVISRMPRPASSEDVFGGSLRGRRLAHFELLEPIGVGGMAAVIRARDLQLERQVALKILPPEMATDEENVRRFHQEARAAAKLDHENIARVFFCGEDQKLHFIAFEFVEGQNLRALIERRGRLPVAEALRYLLQVATGLAHAAERGVIHRDIKPSNIIISPHGRAKLVDMGLARQLDPHRDQGLTQSGVTLGTFDYISPEQALEPRDADVRSDIYSLGCTFYHALTGQPPVPEGTAARKLHHHQHVAPVDPRQLNPDVPDDVAAILARMMAKDPGDRYQRPEHLVQHLMQVAQKLGAITEVPEGVLFVDAPLPSPPRPRPVLMVVAAVLALAVLIVLIGQPGGPANRPGLPPPGPAVAARGVAVPPDAPGPTPPEEHPAPPDEGARPRETTPVADAPGPTYDYDTVPPREKGLAEFLEQHREEKGAALHVRLNGVLDLGDLRAVPAGLVFDGGKDGTLLLEPKDPNAARPVVRLQFDPNRPLEPPALRAGLTVRSGTVTVRGLCFIINARQAPDSFLAAFLLLPAGHVEIEDCVFVQEEPCAAPDHPSRLSAVEVEGTPARDDGPAVTCKRCCFLSGPGAATAAAAVPGQNVLTLRGSRPVLLANCAFGPHAAVVALPGGRDRPGRPPGARVTLEHCSALLAGPSCVFLLDRPGPCTLGADSCLFSQPGPAADESSPAAVLIQQTDDEGKAITWTGKNNRYHNLDAFWLRPMDVITTLEEFQAKMGVSVVQARTDAALAAADSPWKSEEPLKRLDYRNPDRLRQAFQPREQMADLRKPDDARYLVGVEQLPWSDPYNEGLPPLRDRKTERPATARDVKVVNPDDRTRRTGEYSSLADALAKASPGDTVLLHCTGPYPTVPIPLNRANLDVTIRPDRDCHPVLTLAADTDEEEAALFRLRDGKLHLEGLGFLLRPANANFKSQTVVAALGEGECSFKDCVITQDQAADARLATVTLADLPGVMKMTDRPAGQRPAFHFQNCFVRGDGDLVAARAGRPFDLDADNLVVAVNGSFLNREAADDASAVPADVADALRLQRVTAYLGGHLVRFHARDPKALVPVQFASVSDCLFVAAGLKALVHLDGGEASDDRVKELLTWKGAHNAYTDFPEMLDQQPDNGAMPAMPYTQGRWKAFAHESDAAFDRVKLDNRPPADVALTAVTPARFRVKPDEMRNPDMPGTYGADLDQLPKVAAPADAGMTSPDD